MTEVITIVDKSFWDIIATVFNDWSSIVLVIGLFLGSCFLLRLVHKRRGC